MILDQFGRPFTSAKTTAIEARFDNATTTDQSARNFWAADYLSAKAANSFQVRRVLRMRSRYEVSNNPYLWGVCCGNATDLIDSGPTLQVQFKNKKWNVQIEAAWNEWASEVGLVEKLRTCKLARTVDGEGVLILKTAKDLENPVKLYPTDIESDQVCTLAPQNIMESWIDGVDLHNDGTGRVKSYSVMRYHPGDYWYGPGSNPLHTDRIPEKNMVFWFPKFRPGQVRGVPIFTPSLDLFTELRSFRKSVLDAAQTAANHSAVVESDYPPGADADDGGQQNYEFRRVNIQRGMQVVLPYGMRMHQFAATQPGTSYEMFQEKCLGEAIRPLAYPLNLALGTSQKFNFSSAKLDHINYRHELNIERKTEVNNVVLAKLFRAFIEEAATIPGLLPDGIKTASQIPHEWQWPGFESLDPMADAQADQLKLAGGQDTWQDFWARRGKDWMDVFEQLSEGQKKLFELDIEIGEPTKRTETETDAPAKDPKAEAKRRMERAQRRAEASRREYEALADKPRNRITAFDESKRPPAEWFDGCVTAENGSGIKYYHGSKSEFKAFNPDRGGGWVSFSSNKEHAKDFGENVTEVFLKVKNPIDLREFPGSGDIDPSDLRDSLERQGVSFSADEFPEYPDSITSILRPFRRQIRQKALAADKDGIVKNDNFKREADEIIVFKPSQIWRVGSDRAEASMSDHLRAAFDESKHPRDDDGKFGEGSGSGGSDHPSHEHSMSGLADKLPDEAASPGTWQKIKSFISAASKAVYTGAAALGHKLHDLAPDILDVAADYAKIFYAGKGSGRGDTPDPFTESMGVGANTIAVVASHLLGRASVWLKKKIGVSFAAGENGEPIDISAIVDILETMFREMHEDLGIEGMDIDREMLEEMVYDRVEAALEK